MKKKITILTGAGLTVSKDFAGISTWGITDKLRKLEVPGMDISGMRPGEYFYRKLCLHYTGKRKNDCDLATVNFETIIHLLEEMYSYLSSYIKGDKEVRAKYKGVKPAFLRLQETISKDLYKVKSDSKKTGLYQLIKTYHDYFIDAIIKELIEFNRDEHNKGMNSFKADFIEKYLPDSKWTKRLYTLNYDTWINKYMFYYDGFNEEGIFESQKVMQENNFNCHYNLHGCIQWRNSLGANKMEKQKKVVSVLNYSNSSDFGINREPLLATPIITGYHKLERMKYNPFLQFYYSMQKDILDSEMLLIIGYSFTDTHINNLLSLYKGKTIIVDFIGAWNDAEIKMKKLMANPKKLKKAEKKYGPVDPKDIPYDIFDDTVTDKLESFEPLNGGFEPSDKQIAKGWIISKNKKTRVWWKGISEEFYNEWEQIIN